MERILDGVLEEFSRLAAIPRMSGHEKEVSDFLKGYLEELGCRVVQDEVCNIIADKPASPGFEGAPLAILQGHMDMVCVAEEGYDYDPWKDPIRLKRTEKYLEAEGTSLGSDDGIGVAISLYLLKTLQDHGPLRVIFTVDEERGMTGAVHLDRKYLMDAKFLINCDSEDYDEITVGCAGSVHLDFSRALNWQKAKSGKAFRIEVKGLKGGHSGECIGMGRGNAIRTLAGVLRALHGKGAVEIAAFDGGEARNAIPANSAAIIATDLPEAGMQEVLEEQAQDFRWRYGDAEQDISISLVPVAMPENVWGEEDMLAFLRLLQVMHSGVYAMSQTVPGLVETSANIGIARTEGDEVLVQCMPRSSSDQSIHEFCRTAEDLAALAGFDVCMHAKTPAWKENKGSRLVSLLTEIFCQQNGRPMKVGIIHAGLECGWHFQKNPGLDIVSIGVTTENIHTPEERLVLSTVEPQARLIAEALRRIAQCNPALDIPSAGE